MCSRNCLYYILLGLVSIAGFTIGKWVLLDKFDIKTFMRKKGSLVKVAFESDPDFHTTILEV